MTAKDCCSDRRSRPKAANTEFMLLTRIGARFRVAAMGMGRFPRLCRHQRQSFEELRDALGYRPVDIPMRPICSQTMMCVSSCAHKAASVARRCANISPMHHAARLKAALPNPL